MCNKMCMYDKTVLTLKITLVYIYPLFLILVFIKTWGVVLYSQMKKSV
jgi:hypothetical protein